MLLYRFQGPILTNLYVNCVALQRRRKVHVQTEGESHNYHIFRLQRHHFETLAAQVARLHEKDVGCGYQELVSASR